jgi:hypothetical protein
VRSLFFSFFEDLLSFALVGGCLEVFCDIRNWRLVSCPCAFSSFFVSRCRMTVFDLRSFGCLVMLRERELAFFLLFFGCLSSRVICAGSFFRLRWDFVPMTGC